jgi:hypothetical protein
MVDKIIPFLCSPPHSDRIINPFLPRIEVRDRVSESRAGLSHNKGDNLEKY